MASVEQVILDIFQGMANVGTTREQHTLCREARQQSLSRWRSKNLNSVSIAGGLAGIIGGPIGIGLEVVDFGWLIHKSARASYGIGYILDKREVDYEVDIKLILGIWTGTVWGAEYVPAGKVGILLGLKGMGGTGAVVGSKVVAKSAIKAASKPMGKLVAKSAVKTSIKFGQNLAKAAAVKVGWKQTGKTVSKLIPLIGGGVSIAVNRWIINDIMDAAEQYYHNPAVVFNDELGREF